MVYRELESYMNESTGLFDQISSERKSSLKELGLFIEEKVNTGQKVRLTFICTHNSRRSHLSQIWAQTAAFWYRVHGVETYSGGTEATAFNPRAVAALKRAGFKIEKTNDEDNPIYHVRFNDILPVILAFSKTYSHDTNPDINFFAVMNCARAEKECPIVAGAEKRIAIPYDDPGAFDGTENETAVYNESCRQISIEMLYLFSLIK